MSSALPVITMDAGRFAGYLSPRTVYSTAALAFITWIAYKYRSAPRYPPGPPRWLPWIGSLVYLPKRRAWETYEKWGKEYNSDILHLQGAGLNIVLLNSMEVTLDLLERRSAIYSSRASSLIVKLMGWDWLLAVMPYGTAWRERRKLFQKYLHPSRPEVFQPKFAACLQEQLIPNLLEDPSNWVNVFRHAIGSTTISLTYGIPFQESSRLPHDANTNPDDNPHNLDSLIKLAETASSTLNAAAAENAIVIDIIPMLKYFPSWFPGLEFKVKIPEWRRIAAEFRELPFHVGQSMLAKGKAEKSFISLCLDDVEDLEVVKDTAGMIFVAGVDTTLALLHHFAFAMLLHPEVQIRGQQELDQLLATERRQVPEWDDRAKLPYLVAILKEVLRWRPVLPIGNPHAVMEDDEYQGYHIPKGSLIIPNTWLILHDEDAYGPHTDRFQPERFLDEKGQLKQDIRDPADVAFGFGRRICPGMHVALYQLFMVASHVLSLFKIDYATDENGMAKIPSMDWPDLVICPPLPFDCKFVPRGSMPK